MKGILFIRSNDNQAMRGFALTIRRRYFIYRTRNINEVVNIRGNTSTFLVHRPLRRIRSGSLIIRIRANLQLIRGGRLEIISGNANGRRRLRFTTTRPITILINGIESTRPLRRNFNRFRFLFTKLLRRARVNATTRRGRFRSNVKRHGPVKLQSMKGNTPRFLQLRNISLLAVRRNLTTIPQRRASRTFRRDNLTSTI